MPKRTVVLAVFAIAFLALSWNIWNVGIASGYIDSVKKLGAQDESVYTREAIHMATRGDWIAKGLLLIVGISFWTSFIVRTYAWLVILGNRGPVVATYAALGLSQPPQLLFTSFSSTLGMTHILLPYMILALYAVMRRIDPIHLRAAQSLGARPLPGFRTVYLPLSLPGVVNGSVLVFTLCLGFYVTPILLGTPHDMMISQLINQQIETLLAWGFAAALSVILLVVTTAVLLVYNRFAGLDRLWG